MPRFLLLATALILGGCDRPAYQPPPSACQAGEATYACQVERYHNTAAPVSPDVPGARVGAAC